MPKLRSVAMIVSRADSICPAVLFPERSLVPSMMQAKLGTVVARSNRDQMRFVFDTFQSPIAFDPPTPALE
jgi:hypothetical protein